MIVKCSSCKGSGKVFTRISESEIVTDICLACDPETHINNRKIEWEKGPLIETHDCGFGTYAMHGTDEAGREYIGTAEGFDEGFVDEMDVYDIEEI